MAKPPCCKTLCCKTVLISPWRQANFLTLLEPFELSENFRLLSESLKFQWQQFALSMLRFSKQERERERDREREMKAVCWFKPSSKRVIHEVVFSKGHQLTQLTHSTLGPRHWNWFQPVSTSFLYILSLFLYFYHIFYNVRLQSLVFFVLSSSAYNHRHTQQERERERERERNGAAVYHQHVLSQFLPHRTALHASIYSTHS